MSVGDMPVLALAGKRGWAVSLDESKRLVCSGERERLEFAEEEGPVDSVPTSPFSQASSNMDTLEGLLVLTLLLLSPPLSISWDTAGTLGSSFDRAGTIFFHLNEMFATDPPGLL